VEYNKTLEHPGDWVVFGCSYSGALSSWFRAKYPNLVRATLATVLRSEHRLTASPTW